MPNTNHRRDGPFNIVLVERRRKRGGGIKGEEDKNERKEKKKRSGGGGERKQERKEEACILVSRTLPSDLHIPDYKNKTTTKQNKQWKRNLNNITLMSNTSVMWQTCCSPLAAQQ